MDPTRGPAPQAPVRPGLAALLVVGAFLLATLPALPGRPLTRASEARAWVVARSMAATGDVVVPSYHGEARLKKPPLHSWIGAACMAVVGDDGLVVAGLATVIVGLLFALGPLLLGRALGLPEAGLVGSLLLCASRAAGTWGPSPEHDLPFAAFTGLAFVAWAHATGPAGRARHALAAGLACGAALLTKSPLAPAAVWGTALLLAMLGRRPPRPALAATCLVAGTLLPVLGWGLALLARLGSVDALLDEAWRQASGSQGAHRKGVLLGLVYPAGTLLKTTLPWSPVVLALLAAVVARRRRDPAIVAALRALPNVAWGAAAVTLAVLTLTPAKQEHYVLPALVPVGLLAGHVVVVARGLPRANLAVPLTLLGAALVHAALRSVGAATDAPQGALVAALRAAAAPTSIAVAVTGVAWAARFRGRRIETALVVSALLVGFAALVEGVERRARDDVREAAASARALQVRPGALLPTLLGFEEGSGEAFDTVVAWLPHPYVRVRSVDDLRRRLDADPKAWVLTRRSSLLALAPVRPWMEVASLDPARPQRHRDRYVVLRTP